ncbi:MAG: aldo/keto reductase [Aphanocapsa sp. GSE-SYN-MK-11-07L]|nr:aldo/keto reductase [Aphanocapsa sp. GSE-SYN-MK-11-07L]
MATTTLGKTGPTVPPLGIGTWAWGDKLFWGYGDQYGPTEVEAAFRTAVEQGITFFDTAEVYGLGESERLLGEFMKTVSVPVQVATKYGPLPWRFSAEAVKDALTNSLKRLQVDQIALYQVHWPFNFLMSEPTLFEALAIAVQQGKIQAIGVSNYSAEQMTTAWQELDKFSVPLAVNQVRYSLITRQIESQGILAMARKLGVTVLAYSPLAQGLLTGKYTPDHPPKGARKGDARFSQAGLAKLEPVTQLLKQYAQEHDRTPAQVALNWLIAQAGVIPIPGAKTAQQAADNAGAIGWSLSADQVSQLELASRAWL